MRWRWAVVAALLGGAGGLSAQAQQATLGSGGTPPPFVLPPAAYAGKPVLYDPQFLAKPRQDRREGCVPALPCPMELLGTTGRDGGVMLRGTVLSW